MANQKNMEQYEVIIKWHWLKGAHNITYVVILFEKITQLYK